jgi:hypothetical protein
MDGASIKRNADGTIELLEKSVAKAPEEVYASEAPVRVRAPRSRCREGPTSPSFPVAPAPHALNALRGFPPSAARQLHSLTH